MIKKLNCTYGDIIDVRNVTHHGSTSTGVIIVNGEFPVDIGTKPNLHITPSNGLPTMIGTVIEIKRVMWGGINKGYYLSVTQYTENSSDIVETVFERDAAVSWCEVVKGLADAIGGTTKLSKRTHIPRRTLYNWINGACESSHYGKEWADSLGKELLISARVKFMQNNKEKGANHNEC